MCSNWLLVTSGVCEEGETEVSKQSLEVSAVSEPRTVSQDLDSGELGHLIESTRLVTWVDRYIQAAVVQCVVAIVGRATGYETIVAIK